jgi:hypothetical protein
MKKVLIHHNENELFIWDVSDLQLERASFWKLFTLLDRTGAYLGAKGSWYAKAQGGDYTCMTRILDAGKLEEGTAWTIQEIRP